MGGARFIPVVPRLVVAPNRVLIDIFGKRRGRLDHRLVYAYARPLNVQVGPRSRIPPPSEVILLPSLKEACLIRYKRMLRAISIHLNHYSA